MLGCRLIVDRYPTAAVDRRCDRCALSRSKPANENKLPKNFKLLKSIDANLFDSGRCEHGFQTSELVGIVFGDLNLNVIGHNELERWVIDEELRLIDGEEVN